MIIKFGASVVKISCDDACGQLPKYDQYWVKFTVQCLHKYISSKLVCREAPNPILKKSNREEQINIIYIKAVMTFNTNCYAEIYII